MSAPDRLSVEQRILAGVAALGAVFSLAIVIIGAGHGAGPVGLLLVLGSFSAWGWPLVFGWSGVLLTVTALFFPSRAAHVWLGISGLLCLVVSWTLFFLATEVRSFTLVTSLPLFGCVSWRLVQLVFACIHRSPDVR